MDLRRLLRAQWDRSAAVIAVIVGLVALLAGYLGVSGTPHVAAQMPYIISGGLTAIFFLSIGVTLWLSADLRDDWRELRALRLALDLPDTPGAAPFVAADAAEDPEAAGAGDVDDGAGAAANGAGSDATTRRSRPVRAQPEAATDRRSDATASSGRTARPSNGS